MSNNLTTSPTAAELRKMCIRLWAALEAQFGGLDLPFPIGPQPPSPATEQTLQDARELMKRMKRIMGDSNAPSD